TTSSGFIPPWIIEHPTSSRPRTSPPLPPNSVLLSGVHYEWRKKLDLAESGEELARPSTHEVSFRKQAQQLKRLLAEKVLEVDFFKGVLQKIEARRQRSGGSGETAFTTKSGK
ncbi:MAG: hypothetical protein ACRD18_08775, partial [Terriglobia bacterium]